MSPRVLRCLEAKALVRTRVVQYLRFAREATARNIAEAIWGGNAGPRTSRRQWAHQLLRELERDGCVTKRKSDARFRQNYWRATSETDCLG